MNVNMNMNMNSTHYAHARSRTCCWDRCRLKDSPIVWLCDIVPRTPKEQATATVVGLLQRRRRRRSRRSDRTNVACTVRSCANARVRASVHGLCACLCMNCASMSGNASLCACVHVVQNGRNSSLYFWNIPGCSLEQPHRKC